MSPGEFDQETDVDDPLLNRRDVAVLLPGSPPRSRYFGFLAIGGWRLVERERPACACASARLKPSAEATL